jgi:hypothetical protein
MQLRRRWKNPQNTNFYLLAFAVELGGKQADPRRVAAGMGHRLTSPDPTISSVNPRIGMVAVAYCAAPIARFPSAKMTSGWATSPPATRGRARERATRVNRSGEPAEPWHQNGAPQTGHQRRQTKTTRKTSVMVGCPHLKSVPCPRR